MKVHNPLHSKSFSIGAFLGVVWIVFASVITLLAGFDVLKNAAYQKGVANALTQVVTRVSAECKPVTVTAGQRQIDIVNVACLQRNAPAEEAEAEESAEE